jgi:predicted transcriptional regulator
MPAETWTFVTNHGHVFLCIAEDPQIRMKEVAERVGITERSAQRIVADLLAEGYITMTKAGRRNAYKIHPELPLRHPMDRENQVGVLLKLLNRKPRTK